MTREEAISVWALLGAAAPGAALTREQVEIRAELILDLDFAAAQSSAIRLAQQADWMPSVATFRRAVIQPDAPDSDQAWAEVIGYVGAHGWPSPPTADSFSHPAIWDAVRGMGDWQAFCASDEMVNRAHFLKMWPAIHDRHERDALVDPNVALALENRRRELGHG